MPTPADRGRHGTQLMVVHTMDDEEAVFAAAQVVVKTHHALAEWLRIGVTLGEVDAFVAQLLQRLEAKSCFLGYRVRPHPPFPGHACLSVNSCIVHGHPAAHQEPLKAGDVLKIDIGVLHQGWVGDAAWTYVFGHKTPLVQSLTDCGKQSIALGLEALRPEARLFEWARTLQHFVEVDRGFHLIRRLGGHGYGRTLHEAPFIANTTPSFPGEWPDANTKLKPGMLLAVEPMIAVSTGEYVQEGAGWPLYTADGSQAVHYEHDVLITEDGMRVLTAGLEQTPDLIEK